jgi:hypothetical protein
MRDLERVKDLGVALRTWLTSAPFGNDSRSMARKQSVKHVVGSRERIAIAGLTCPALRGA